MVTFPFSWIALCSRKASLKDKVFPSPSKAPVAKGKAQSPGAEDGAEPSPSKVSKSWSFNEKNRGPKHAFKVRGSTSRQNSEGERTYTYSTASDGSGSVDAGTVHGSEFSWCGRMSTTVWLHASSRPKTPQLCVFRREVLMAFNSLQSSLFKMESLCSNCRAGNVAI